MNLREQIAAGKLVCPQSRKRLFWGDTNSFLVTSDGSAKYAVLEGSVPVLLTDAELYEECASAKAPPVKQNDSLLQKVKGSIVRDYRTEASIEAFRDVIQNAAADALCLSVGGGPSRPAPNLINLNIYPFPEVDVVADAHSLPYSDNSVDAILCEAVLEHLHDPNLAVTEMHRVLRPGGKILAITPFLQPYHGHPHHYQNFTLKGHVQLFQSNGFQIADSGTCVGPTFAMAVLTYNYITEYLPLGKLLSKIFSAAALIVIPLDKLINRKAEAHIVASTTYVVATKTNEEAVADSDTSARLNRKARV